ncbi:hypothetical protein [Streptomyces sp. NPDC026673]|uniref:hypothetical protein n=1 Tax=Streptomyces sp. NPDC026673 TaxID=3155724 RepID=UPI0033C3579A
MIAIVGCSQNNGDSAAPSHTASSSAHTRTSQPPQENELAIPEDADDETKQQYLIENAIAACMRAQGFTYTPNVTDWGPSSPVDGQDYELAKNYRAKYGFGIYAPGVYPDDPAFNPDKFREAQILANPDRAYLEALPAAQRKAYDLALGDNVKIVNGRSEEMPGCARDARTKVYGPEKSPSELDREQAANEEHKLTLNGDPQLNSLAQQFASCLRKEGIAVTTTQPTAIGDMVKFATSAQLPMDGVQSMDEDAARAGLTKEIINARKDLECGKKFRAAYFPKLAKHPFSSEVG